MRKFLEGKHFGPDVMGLAAVEQGLGKKAFSVEVMQRLAEDSQLPA